MDNQSEINKPEPNKELNELKEDVRAQLAELREAVWRVTESQTMEHAMRHGFKSLIDQLEPLRDLAPQRTLLSETELERLRQLRASLARPIWSSAGSLSVQEMRVPFIGEVPVYSNGSRPPLNSVFSPTKDSLEEQKRYSS
jgi:hypothetical protein